MEPQHTSKQRRRSRRLLIWSVGGAVLALLVVVAVAGSFPPACKLCHGVQAREVAATAHGATSCYQCHLGDGAWSLPGQKVSELAVMYPKALTGLGYRGPVVQTARTACLECHASVLKEPTASGGLRMNHATCAPGGSCDGCHAKVAHAKGARWSGEPTMEDCVACHTQQNASVECDTCHLETKERVVRARGPWQVTHGKDWQKTHGMGRTDSCATCHPKDFCTKCHGVAVPHPAEFGATHGQLAVDDIDSCLQCHRSRRFCDACHGIAMPHPTGFLRGHAAQSRGTQDARCLRCHDPADCDNCHSNHVHPGGTKGVPVPWTYTGQGSQ